VGRIIAHLMGGLGNQLFQYAACRSMAIRSNFELFLDGNSGFKNDRVFRRKFELNSFPVQFRFAGMVDNFVTLSERILSKMFPTSGAEIAGRPWGNVIRELDPNVSGEIANHVAVRTSWIYGHFQSEDYF
jgi:hypothetical protein